MAEGNEGDLAKKLQHILREEGAASSSQQVVDSVNSMQHKLLGKKRRPYQDPTDIPQASGESARNVAFLDESAKDGEYVTPIMRELFGKFEELALGIELPVFCKMDKILCGRLSQAVRSNSIFDFNKLDKNAEMCKEDHELEFRKEEVSATGCEADEFFICNSPEGGPPPTAYSSETHHFPRNGHFFLNMLRKEREQIIYLATVAKAQIIAPKMRLRRNVPHLLVSIYTKAKRLLAKKMKEFEDLCQKDMKSSLGHLQCLEHKWQKIVRHILKINLMFTEWDVLTHKGKGSRTLRTQRRIRRGKKTSLVIRKSQRWSTFGLGVLLKGV